MARYTYEIRDWETGETVLSGRTERIDLVNDPEIRELICRTLKNKDETVFELLVFSREAMEYYGLWKAVKLSDPSVPCIFSIRCNGKRVCVEPMEECEDKECEE